MEKKDPSEYYRDRVTANCLSNNGQFQILNRQGEKYCRVDKSNLPADIVFSCPYNTCTRVHLIDIAYAALGCDYIKK